MIIGQQLLSMGNHLMPMGILHTTALHRPRIQYNSFMAMPLPRLINTILGNRQRTRLRLLFRASTSMHNLNRQLLRYHRTRTTKLTRPVPQGSYRPSHCIILRVLLIAPPKALMIPPQVPLMVLLEAQLRALASIYHMLPLHSRLQFHSQMRLLVVLRRYLVC